MRYQPVIADRNSHPRRNVHDDKVHPVKQRITDQIPIEGNANNCGGSKGTEQETGAVGKS